MRKKEVKDYIDWSILDADLAMYGHTALTFNEYAVERLTGWLNLAFYHGKFDKWSKCKRIATRIIDRYEKIRYIKSLEELPEE